jgi:hypothetical protein
MQIWPPMVLLCSRWFDIRLFEWYRKVSFDTNCYKYYLCSHLCRSNLERGGPDLGKASIHSNGKVCL